MPHYGGARATASGLRAPEAGAEGAGPPRPASGPASRERVLAFAGAALTAVFVPCEAGKELRLVESAGDAPATYGLPERFPVFDGSPVADTFRAGRSLWLNAATLASRDFRHEDGPATLDAGVSLGVLPLGTAGRWMGCLVIVGEAPDGFGAEQRDFLERYSGAIADRLRGEADRSAPAPLLDAALRSLGVGTFSLRLGTGLVDTDTALLELLGTREEDFDGKADTLLSYLLPEDLPALMSVVEPSPQAAGRRELEFRIRRPTGELRWLHLGCRVLTGPDGGPERVVGGGRPRPRRCARAPDDVSRVQWLTAALDDATTVRDVSRVVVAALREPLGADRVALAEVQEDRLAVTVLDPPEAGAWPELWRAEWHAQWPGRTGPCPADASDGRCRTAGCACGPRAPRSNPGSRASAPEGWPCCRCRPRAGSPGCAWSAGTGRTSSAPRSGPCSPRPPALVGQALKRAHAYDAEQELATMLQRSLLPRRLPELPGGIGRRPLSARQTGAAGGR